MCDLPTGLFEVVARAMFYPVGWPIVKLLTLGKYPVKAPGLRKPQQQIGRQAWELPPLQSS